MDIMFLILIGFTALIIGALMLRLLVLLFARRKEDERVLVHQAGEADGRDLVIKVVAAEGSPVHVEQNTTSFDENKELVIRMVSSDPQEAVAAATDAGVYNNTTTTTTYVFGDTLPQMEETQPFIFLRRDAMDHIMHMRTLPERFPIHPDFEGKTVGSMPDYLICGDRVFALMFERNEVVLNFTVRLSPESAKRNKLHHTLTEAVYPYGGDWYDIVVDNSFESKKEVYKLLEESYDYTVSLFYGEGGACAEAAKEERDEIARNASDKEKELEERLIAAEREYLILLEQYRLANPQVFRITRREIADDVTAMNLAGVEVCERLYSPQLPMSLKFKSKTYAMLHAMDDGVLMTVQLSEDFAEELKVRHTDLCKSKFPKGTYWFTLPIGAAFENKDEVYNVLEYARAFVESKYLAALAAKKAKAAKKAEIDAAKKAEEKARKKAEMETAKEARAIKKAEMEAARAVKAAKKAELDAAKAEKAARKAEIEAAQREE